MTTAKFQNEALEKTNQVRSIHGVPNLQLRDNLTENARKWGIMLLRKAKKDRRLNVWFSHHQTEGENVFIESSAREKNISPTKVVLSWYCEVIDHSWEGDENKFTENTTQFSQVTWKGTKEMGIVHLMDNHTGNAVVVARYYPTGNLGYKISFKENVLEPNFTAVSNVCHERINAMGIEYPPQVTTESTDYDEFPKGRSLDSFAVAELPPALSIQTTPAPAPTTTTTYPPIVLTTTTPPPTTTESTPTTTEATLLTTSETPVPTSATTTTPRTTTRKAVVTTIKTTTKPTRPPIDPMGKALPVLRFNLDDDDD
ncbi:unnamed protein product [Orchesella dallaii]|uniref:SCP domain-containing protein n=1 Tax=Orchesella dallaii TaxID=48710 RepID=A0ABP1RHR0_9HEXA